MELPGRLHGALWPLGDAHGTFMYTLESRKCYLNISTAESRQDSMFFNKFP